MNNLRIRIAGFGAKASIATPPAALRGIGELVEAEQIKEAKSEEKDRGKTSSVPWGRRVRLEVGSKHERNY